MPASPAAALHARAGQPYNAPPLRTASGEISERFMGILWALAVIIGCLALSAFFSGSETALLRLRSHELEEEIEARKGPAALAARDLLRNTSRLLVTILFGNNIANILGASVASALAVTWLGPDLGIAVSTVIMTLLVFVFCEVMPKAFAAHHPRGVSNVVAVPLYVIHQVLWPLHFLFDRFIDPLVKRVAGELPDDTSSSAEEILRLARLSQSGKPSTGTPMAIIGAAADAESMTVSDILVPRTEIAAYPIDIDPKLLLDELLEERFTRAPIYRDSIDTILGVVHFKDLVKLVGDGGKDVSGILKSVLRVPERKPILNLLADMQRAFVHVAIVKDEFGVTQGLVTQEDILEELVGEIRDEFDREELLTIRKVDEDTYEALGRIKVLDFNRESGWDIPAERGDTLAGLVFNRLGRAPRRWEMLEVPGYEIVVVDVSGSRITEVRVRRREEEPAAGGDE
jgi:putative hemolysin